MYPLGNLLIAVSTCRKPAQSSAETLGKDSDSAENLLIYNGEVCGVGIALPQYKGKRESESGLGTPLCKEKLLRKSEEELPNQ